MKSSLVVMMEEEADDEAKAEGGAIISEREKDMLNIIFMLR